LDQLEVDAGLLERAGAPGQARSSSHKQCEYQERQDCAAKGEQGVSEESYERAARGELGGPPRLEYGGCEGSITPTRSGIVDYGPSATR